MAPVHIISASLAGDVPRDEVSSDTNTLNKGSHVLEVQLDSGQDLKIYHISI